MEQIVDLVLDAMTRSGLVQVEVSARHVHLSQEDLERLFGPGAALTPRRDLSQPGQFLSEERVTIIGPKGKKERTAILGPVRKATQVELSKTDCAELGVIAPIRESGDLAESAALTLQGPVGSITIPQGVIVAKNHIHMTPETAKKLDLADRQSVRVKVLTDRPIRFEDVLIRVSPDFRDRMHLDYDEANAANVTGFTLGQILLPK